MGKWLDLLESETSDKTEKRHRAEVSKVSKVRKHPFGTFGTFGTTAQGVFQNKNSEDAKRYPYRFRLHGDGGSGTYLTDEPDLDKARDVLLDRYGARLAVVVKV
jgi:hypothetical protein